MTVNQPFLAFHRDQIIPFQTFSKHVLNKGFITNGLVSVILVLEHIRRQMPSHYKSLLTVTIRLKSANKNSSAC